MSPSGPARSLFALWLLLISAGLARAQSNDRAIAGSADSTAGAAAIPDTAAADRPGRNPAIVVGERLVFSVRYGKIPAGEATLSIVDRTTVDGHDCFHVVSTASSSAVFDKVYPVRDRYESYMDVDSLWSRHFEKHLREGRYKADQVVRLDQEAGIARYHDGREFPIPRGTYDVIARAVQPFNDPRPPRVEILRDVAVMDPREVALNVDRVGVDTVPAGLTVDGAVPSYASVGTWTAAGSWFAHSAFYRQPWVLPARVLRPSDTTEATIERDGGWARFPYVGPVDRPVPVELVDATLGWDPLPVAAVDTVGDWRWISLWVGDFEFRKWRVWAEPALVADEGEVRVEAPAVDGWDPAWLPDPDRERWWEVRWHRELADGSYEGRHAGTTFLSY